MFQERELLPCNIIPTDVNHEFWNQNLNLALVIYWLCDIEALSYLNSLNFIFLTNLKWIESTPNMIVVKTTIDNIDHPEHIIYGRKMLARFSAVPATWSVYDSG